MKRARESSLQVRGAKLFNTIPRDIMDTVTDSTDHFKAKLDDWLSNIQDQPSIPGRPRVAATGFSFVHSNTEHTLNNRHLTS
jgi:hypothetical protein